MIFRRSLRPMFFAPLSLLFATGMMNSQDISTAQTPGQMTGLAGTARTVKNFGKIPIWFEENKGQADARCRFIAHAGAYTALVTDTEIMFVLPESPSPSAKTNSGIESMARQPEFPSRRTANVRMSFSNSNPRSSFGVGSDRPLEGTVNYFIGDEPKKWITKVPTYKRVTMPGLWKGIDVEVHGSQTGLEYDFIVSPGSDPGDVVLNYEGADSSVIDENGDLSLATQLGRLVHRKPVAYQVTSDGRHEVPAGYVIAGGGVRFQVGDYNHALPLVIDPVINWSTYFFNYVSNTSFGGMAVDPSGNTYLVGTANNFLPTFPGTYPTPGLGASAPGGVDVFVSKLNPSGTGLVYSDYYGGSATDNGYGIAVDSQGAAYICGYTTSANIPRYPTTTGNPYPRSYTALGDAFVAKISADGTTLIYSTPIGGATNIDLAYAVTVDSSYNAYVTGYTESTDFPTFPTSGPLYQRNFGGIYDAFIVKINPSGTSPVFSTYAGGAGSDFGTGIAVDSSSNVFVSGYTTGSFPTTPGSYQSAYGGGASDSFLLKLNAGGTSAFWATYLGGINSDYGYGVAVDSANNPYMVGEIGSNQIPTSLNSYSGGQDGYLAKFNGTNGTLPFFTYLGGSSYDSARGVAVDGVGIAYITGETASFDFPTTSNTLHNFLDGGYDAFVSVISPTNITGNGQIILSQFLGGYSSDYATAIGVDGLGHIYVAGATYSANFPTTPSTVLPVNPSLSPAGFVTQISIAYPSNTEFVTQMYLDVLYRTADPGGLALFTGYLNSGSLGRGDVVSDFITSAEFQAHNLMALVGAYITTLNRDPDGPGFLSLASLTYRGVLNSTNMTEAFLNSTEYQLDYGSLSLTGFINQMYLNGLNRPVDSAGLNYWLNTINSGAMTRGQFVYSVITSAEFQQKNYLRFYSDLLYLLLLQRAATPAELATTETIYNTQSYVAAALALVNSPGYLARFY